MVEKNGSEERLSVQSATETKQLQQIEREKEEAETEVTLDSILLYPDRPAAGDEIGRLQIPALNMALPILHGTDDEQLDVGVGHYRGSVLPGEPDHSVLSAHRDTFFRDLKDITLGDEVVVSTIAGTFTYVVVDIYIVDQHDTTVIRPTDKPTLSLTTCYPFYYVGNAPERYIVKTELHQFTLNE